MRVVGWAPVRSLKGWQSVFAAGVLIAGSVLVGLMLIGWLAGESVAPFGQ